MNLNVTVLQYALNQRSFDALQDDLRQQFSDLLRIRSQMCAQDYYSGPVEDEAYARLRAGRCEILDLDPAERERWRSELQPLRDRFVAENEAEGRPATAMLEEMERLSALYSPLSREEIMTRVTENPIQGIIDL